MHKDEKVILVANLPYYITTQIIEKVLTESKVIDETDQEIYEYGLEILSENVMLTVFLLLFGVAIGRGVETGIFLFSF